MLEQFNTNLSVLIGEPNQKKFLLAVSGGIDSVVMAHLFRDSGLHYGIAHCNFQLRGKESETDLKFVKKLAITNGVPFYSVIFDTMDYVKKNKVSVQMAARELRYNWFNEISTKNGYDYVVTAHHADDAIETFFINLLRGTGISGLTGIPAVSENIIRPMLPFSRKEIEIYSKKNGVKWREDKSNEKDNYLRNKIRHHLIPALDKVEPKARQSIRKSMEMLDMAEQVYRSGVDIMGSEYFERYKQNVKIDLKIFSILKYPIIVLYENIKEFGFNYETCQEIAEVAKKKRHSGKVFISNTHRLNIDRTYLFISKKELNFDESYTISEKTNQINLGRSLCSFESRIRDKKYKPNKSPKVASLDFDKLSFPLEIRKWKAGDRFYPIGMKHSKKVSDFLIDNKVSLPDKAKTLLLVSGNKVAWVMGYRIDDRFKITETTKKLYLCTLTTKNLT